jgi:uncharacterized protein (DUF302 family)
VFHLAESSKSFQEVVFELEPAIQRLGLTVLARHDLGEALGRRSRSEARAFDEEYLLLDIVGWRAVEELLAADLRAGLALPWRFAVYTEDGATRLGFQPVVAPADDVRLARWIAEVEDKLVQLIDEMR